MRIIFADPWDWDYDVGTPFDLPLGGIQSAGSYLAIELAALGHAITFITSRRTSGFVRGVSCLSWKHIAPDTYQRLNPDAFILLMLPPTAAVIRPLLPASTQLIFWTGHTSDQPAVECLKDPACRNAIDAFCFISDFQRNDFVSAYPIDPNRSRILRNAAGPAFVNLFTPGQPILPVKVDPPILAYTSTPYRGLSTLVELFPEIRRRVPGTRLQVFSSMKVYQAAAADDVGTYGPLYDLCRRTEGIEYVGSIPQPALAGHLKSAALLAYPNHTVETSCIALIEAMAAGCDFVTSDLGALRETAAGYGALIPLLDTPPELYRRQFIDAIVAALQRRQGPDRPALDARLAEQVAFINREYTWRRRAQEWTAWLQSLPPRGRGAAGSI